MVSGLVVGPGEFCNGGSLCFLVERGEGEEGRGAGRKREGGAGVGYSSNLIPFSCGTT